MARGEVWARRGTLGWAGLSRSTLFPVILGGSSSGVGGRKNLMGFGRFVLRSKYKSRKTRSQIRVHQQGSCPENWIQVTFLQESGLSALSQRNPTWSGQNRGPKPEGKIRRLFQPFPYCLMSVTTGRGRLSWRKST